MTHVEIKEAKADDPAIVSALHIAVGDYFLMEAELYQRINHAPSDSVSVVCAVNPLTGRRSTLTASQEVTPIALVSITYVRKTK